MFTPLKNLITYIQKNAGGSTFFGGSSSNTELSEDTMMESEIIPSSSTQLPELACVSNDKNHDQNENDILDASTASSIDDPLLIKEGECEKDIYLDFPSAASETEENDVEFPTSEVVVLDDPDLNTSVTSDPGTDPLAIDDYNGPSVANSPNPLESSADHDALYMVNIGEMESGKTSQTRDDVDRDDTGRVLSVGKDTDEQELRSDGSDSGLGSETSALQTTATSVTDSSACSTASSSPIVEQILPVRSNLKRRLEDIDGGQHVQKKLKRAINFEGVKVFYFPRIQGHGCVPSQGGCTLGMAAHHISFKTFSLAEHAAEVRRAHKLQLQEINPRGSSSEESDSEEEMSDGSGSDLDAETIGFLQPVPPKQRRALLKAAGVRKIDPNEKIECRNIRNSREVCGCTCRDFCDPDTCACSQAGIKCQVDRAMFPCGCSRDACGNVIGRVEFNPARVRTHFIHTIMRLEMENRQQKRPEDLAVSTNHLGYNTSSVVANNSTALNSYNPLPNYGMEPSTSAYHHHMHPQQNAYINHMSATHPANTVYANLSNPMVMDSSTTQTHIPYVSTIATEPDSISSSLAMNGNALHYPDGSLYPQVQPSPLPLPPTPATSTYGNILAPYVTTPAYHNGGHVVDVSSYPTNVYTNYHNPHHLHNHVQQPQQQFLGYSPSCSGDMNEYSETQSSFISLNTPEASSSRLSAINDLLHNSRNITTALVAITSQDVPSVPESVIDNMDQVDTFVVEEKGDEIVNEVSENIQENQVVDEETAETLTDKGSLEISSTIPVESMATETVESAESTPTDSVEYASIESAESTPIESDESTPTELAESTPIESVECTPIESVECTPIESSKSTLIELVESKPIESDEPKPIESTPIKSSDSTLTELVESKPIESVESAPIETAESTPTESVESPQTVSVEMAESTIAEPKEGEEKTTPMTSSDDDNEETETNSIATVDVLTKDDHHHPIVSDATPSQTEDIPPVIIETVSA